MTGPDGSGETPARALGPTASALLTIGAALALTTTLAVFWTVGPPAWRRAEPAATASGRLVVCKSRDPLIGLLDRVIGGGSPRCTSGPSE